MTAVATAALAIDDLWVEAGPRDRPVTLLRGVSLAVAPGEILGLVGESGSGKTVTCMSVLGLAGRGIRVTRGSAHADGIGLIGADRATMQRVRGAVVGTVFQDPLSALNPIQRVGVQIIEAMQVHDGGARRTHRSRAVALLDQVGVPMPDKRMRAYPHELSGGLRQRVAIAMALANDPRVLVADEPTTALDVTIQAQVLALIEQAAHEQGRAALLVTHDLGLVAQVADRVAVMYAGQVVEQGPVARVLGAPAHPYTRGLLDSRPRLEPGRRRLPAMPGRPPLPSDWGSGCAFAPRCPRVHDRCAELPEMRGSGGHAVRCWAPLDPGDTA